MSINIGTEGVNAARALRGNGHFEALLKAILGQTQTCQARALERGSTNTIYDAGYASAMRDLWIAMAAAMTEQRQNAIDVPVEVPPRLPGKAAKATTVSSGAPIDEVLA